MSDVTVGELLPCGRDAHAVADDASQGTLDAHETGCPYCRAVVDVARHSARLGEQAAGVEVADPPDLVVGVMRTIRGELRPSRELPVPSPDGAAFVTDHVVVTVLRDALDAAGGLVVSSCVVAPGPEGLAVRVEAYGRYPDDLRAGAADLRRRVADTLRTGFALDAGEVDVAVVDLIGRPR